MKGEDRKEPPWINEEIRKQGQMIGQKERTDDKKEVRLFRGEGEELEEQKYEREIRGYWEIYSYRKYEIT